MQNEMRTVLRDFKDELKAELKEDITEELRREIRGTEYRLGLRMDAIDDCFDGIDHRLDAMDDRFDGVNGSIKGINERLDSLESDVTDIKLILENDIGPKIGILADGYKAIEERLDREAAEEREYREKIDYRIAALVNQN